ncbi:MAG TPA: BrnT family toxin [Acidobacteriota bacterium]
MRLVEDSEAAAWLECLTGEPDDFEWDEGNRTKHRKHGVATRDVEAMLHQPLLFAGRIIEPVYEEIRWLALGQDNTGRRLTLIFTRRGDRVRSISCRPMRRKERKLYEEAIAEREE